MKLTGKAREGFNEWYWINYYSNKHIAIKSQSEDYFNSLEPLFKAALIIEWFDKEGYTIDRNTQEGSMYITDWTERDEILYILDCDYLKPFGEWWDAAIEKTNELYNETR